MIVCKTPYRISFFGGGSDYPQWYEEHGGKVLSTTINHGIYLQSRYLPPFFGHKHRIVWRLVEEVCSESDIQHPCVRAVFEYYKPNRGIELHYSGDLPARTGIASSSAFTVGLIRTIHSLRSEFIDKKSLAKEAIFVEQQLLQENVGIQDQIAAAYGGLNLY